MHDFRDDLFDHDGVIGADGDAEHAAKIDAAIDLVENGPGTDERMLGLQRLGRLRARHDLIMSSTFSKSPRIRSASAEALGWFTSITDRERLEALTADPVHHVRISACRGLSQGGHADAFDLLKDIAVDPGEDGGVRRAAILGAARLSGAVMAGGGEHTASAVMEVASELRSMRVIDVGDLARVLGAIDSPAAVENLELLIEDALSRGCDAPTARALLLALGRHALSDNGASLTLRALDSLPGGRTAACRLLVRQPDERARSSLERLVNDPNTELVATAVAALCKLGIGSSLGALQKVFEADNTASAAATMRLEGPDGVALAEQLARCGRMGLRGIALERLGQIDPGHAVGVAEDLVHDPNPHVRAQAFKVLIEHSPDLDIWIQAAISDPVEWVARRFRDDVAAADETAR